MRLCKTCGDEVPYQGFGRPRIYCSAECKQQSRGGERKPAPAPPIRIEKGDGPWTWEVGERYVVTVKPFYPKNTGNEEMARCGIVADFRDRQTAEKFAQRLHEKRLDLHKKHGLQTNTTQ